MICFYHNTISTKSSLEHILLIFGLSYYIFSWNGTGAWDNATNGTINGNSQKLIINKSTNKVDGIRAAAKKLGRTEKANEESRCLRN